MKIKKELVAIMDKYGNFLSEYGNEVSLAYQARWTDDVEHAAVIPVEYYEKQKEKYESMAKMFGGQLVNIEAKYEVKTLDGEEPEITEHPEDKLEKVLDEFLENVFGGRD